MTRDELAAVRARAKAATPGEWEAGDYGWDILADEGAVWLAQTFIKADGSPLPYKANAAFIAAANPAAVLRLLAHIDWLEGLLADAALDGAAGGLALRYRRALEGIAGMAEWHPRRGDEIKMRDIARKALED